eukprot:CAMPEP_0179140668 /NCGR_PEP_ID=MMETSP0796-20121207/67385_1 /TAXON_ID=73915 /ORGANISM="Pyrodinium bahamense, Strain pbaha01" /LENGTH=147 /DNA_ID=CAMNT_0020840259 /DNA_START=22 /DNA_END=462 /DNA_ORIENTATION=-
MAACEERAGAGCPPAPARLMRICSARNQPSRRRYPHIAAVELRCDPAPSKEAPIHRLEAGLRLAWCCKTEPDAAPGLAPVNPAADNFAMSAALLLDILAHVLVEIRPLFEVDDAHVAQTAQHNRDECAGTSRAHLPFLTVGRSRLRL